MKRLALLFAVLLALDARATDLLFNLTDFRLSPISVRPVKITPITIPAVGTTLVVGDFRQQVTGTNGQTTFTNVTSGAYKVEVIGATAVTPFTILVPSTNVTVNAADLITSAYIVMPGFGDTRFVLKSNSWSINQTLTNAGFGGSTNIFRHTNGATAGSVVTTDGTNAFWGPQVTVAITNIPTARTLWVATNGNDSTGIRGRFENPFLTYTAAKNASFGGDLIWIRSGEFLLTNGLKNLVNIWNEGTLTNLGTLGSAFENSMFHDYSGATTNVIGGPGEYKFLYETNIASTFTGGIISLSNAASMVVINAPRMQVRHFTTDNQISAFRIINCGSLVANVGEIIDPDIDRVSPDAFGGEAFSIANGIYWKNGNCFFNVSRMETENGYSIWSDGSTNSLYYKGLLVRNKGGNAFYNSATSANSRTWVDVLEVDALNGSVFSSIPGSGKVYLTGQKLRGCGLVPVISVGGQEMWVRAEKITAGTSAAGVQSYFIEAQAGKLWLNTLQWETEGPINGGPAVRISGGSNYISGGQMSVSNATGVQFSGSQSTRLVGMTIQTVNTSGSGNTNSPIEVLTNGVTVQNMTLVAASAVDSIKATNTINPVAIEGFLQVNTAPSATTLFSSGSLMQTTNLTVWGNLTPNLLTASRAVVSGASKQLSSSATTATELGYVNGVTSPLQTQIDAKSAGGYVLTGFMTISSSPADSTTYYVGAGVGDQLTTVYNDVRMEVPKAGTIKRFWVKVRVLTVLGSGESVNYYVRLNDTTDVGNVTATWSAAMVETASSSVSQAVVAGDFVNIKIATPAWVTNPTGVRVYAMVYIE